MKQNIANLERGVLAVNRVADDKQLSRLLTGRKQVTSSGQNLYLVRCLLYGNVEKLRCCTIKLTKVGTITETTGGDVGKCK